MEENQNNFEERLSSELNAPGSFFNTKEQKEYRSSPLQKETYERLQRNDILYQKFIIQTYGSYENFLQQSKIMQDINVYDPTIDYIMDVTVVTENAFFKTNHISSQEIIMENMSGLCSVWFTKQNGTARRLNCTLDSKYMPTKEYDIRSRFFSPLPNDRIGVWDVNQQKWKSFYMKNVFKFVRDDTSGVE